LNDSWPQRSQLIPADINDCCAKAQEMLGEVTMLIVEPSPCRSVEPRESRSRFSRRIALIDAEGNIVAVNKDWIDLAEDTGTPLSCVGPGVNYLEVCRQANGSIAAARKARTGIQAVLKRRTSSFAMDYSCHTPFGLNHFRMSVTPIVYGDARAAIEHADISDLHLAKEKDFKRLQQFARRLINAQEEERQRIARELHDDLGNRIALTSLTLRQIRKEFSSENFSSGMRGLDKAIADMADLSMALRDVSHQLHPAPLRYLGVRGALKALEEGFKKSCGIRIDVVVPPDMPRLPDHVEVAIYRITQEGLQNVARHSGADRVEIVLEYTPRRIRLTVSDTGWGFVRSEALQKGGLGLLSMEERALSIRGRLMINTSPGAGTEIRLTIPMLED
jgi:signal transduction histidine kinase